MGDRLTERPTCKTCVHFSEAPFAPANGQCRKEPPSPVVAHDDDGTPIVLPWIPPVESDYGCSHHPDFPAWIAAARRRRATPDCDELSCLDELDTRTRLVLESEGITTLPQLAGRTADDILYMRNIGKVSFAKIEAMLANHGLAFRRASSPGNTGTTPARCTS